MTLRLTQIIGICLSVLLAGSGCERYNTKKNARDRRVEYFKHYSDSLRTAQDLYKDSVRRAKYGLPPLQKNDTERNKESGKP